MTALEKEKIEHCVRTVNAMLRIQFPHIHVRINADELLKLLEVKQAQQRG